MLTPLISPLALQSLLEKLLPRSPDLATHPIDSLFFKGQRILITGAGGFIGQQLTRQILSYQPECLLACDQSEIGLHQLLTYVESRDLQNSPLKLVLASAAHTSFLDAWCQQEQPQIIIHAAAYKHVNLVEQNASMAYANNLLSAWNVLQLAQKYAVKHCLLISSDKAKDPVNAMGYSKYLAELLFQYQALEYPETHYRVVRFGNVLGSSGSLIPKLMEQISHGWDVTLTDRCATRYFMSLSEAIHLTLCAMQLDAPKGILSIDMGQPILIGDLIDNFLALYRQEIDPNVGVRIREIGLYPGERLHEPCLIDASSMQTAHPRIYVSASTLPMDPNYFWKTWQGTAQNLERTPFDLKVLQNFMCNTAP